MAASILTSIGLERWVARDKSDYLDLAHQAAGMVDDLARSRQSRRQRLAELPAANPDRYTRAVEDAYRVMWRKWCLS